MTVRVRFAPSPTGFVHIGGLRTALYNYLFAKKNDGKYIMRIEDTDQERYVEGAIEGMLRSMAWAGINHDEGVVLDEERLSQKGDFGPYIQSQRLDIYQKYIKTLLESGDAYYCFCSKERLDRIREEQRTGGLTAGYDGHCRNLPKEEVQKRLEAGEQHVIRLKLPKGRDIKFNDIIRGEVLMNTDDLDDQVLIKSDGFPTYHFAVVVDDYLMGITHIIRGEEWLSSTPKHVYLYEAFGWEVPQYVHLPNILNRDHKKLSKRHGDVAVEDFLNRGYLPEGLVNYIALVGWSPEDNQEIFSIEELEQKFSLERVSKSSGIFDINKLNWVNEHYIRESPVERITDLAIPYLIKAGYITEIDVKEKYEWLRDLVSVLQDRISYVAEIKEKAAIFFKTEIELKDDESRELIKSDHLPQLLDVFKAKVEEAETVDENFGKKVFKEIQKETGIKGPNLYKPIRVVLTGEAHGPDLPLVIKILGRQNILNRVQYIKRLLNHC